MTVEQRLMLKLVAGLLDYPGGREFWRRVDERLPLADELDSRLGDTIRVFQQTGSLELQKIYVQTFDFDEQCSLYVTAHELGDSRGRGQALIALIELYRQAGYEVPDHQIADFLPTLLEWGAVHPGLMDATLRHRVGGVARHIGERLGYRHVYHALFLLVVEILGSPEDQDSLRTSEQPDLVDLPYPIEYP